MNSEESIRKSKILSFSDFVSFRLLLKPYNNDMSVSKQTINNLLRNPDGSWRTLGTPLLVH